MSSFKNPSNGYIEEASGPFSWLWCLLFGVFYFAVKGNWKHVAISFVLALLTSGISWLIYPFFVYQINESYFQTRGWIKVD
jgi:hypothetical protein